MNIQQAKEEIARTFRIYMKKNPQGGYCIPIEKQRPVLLIGPPGIGKTAIMKQIAQEEGIGLAAYAMTHHTRQSAIGLPTIREKEYGGRVYAATEYTMSEIVASIYEVMEETGKKQGILFLDEINCVSETLAPVMLQLLQSKMFGTHRIPEGWMIVAAGNPPEYNKSVRELDMATLDRVKNIDIEADLSVWMRYGKKAGVHEAVRSYLTAHPEHFYCIETTKKGQFFATARGWEDLSCMLRAYEEEGLAVGEDLILQYIQHDEIARSFALFYELFAWFQARQDGLGLWKGGITCGTDGRPEDAGVLKQAGLAQGLALASQLLSAIRNQARQYQELAAVRRRLGECVTGWRETLLKGTEGKKETAAKEICEKCQGSVLAAKTLEERIRGQKQALQIKEQNHLLENWEIRLEERVIRELEELLQTIVKGEKESPCAVEEPVLEKYDRELKKLAGETARMIEQSYRLLEQVPGEETLLYFTTDLTGEEDCGEILMSEDCPSYRRYGEQLMLSIKEKNLE